MLDLTHAIIAAAAIALACAVSASSAPRSAELPAPSELPARPELPEVLQLLDGRTVAAREAWESERRPELRRLFQRYMYGPLPPAPPGEHFSVDREDRHALGGKATLREVTIHLGADNPPAIPVLLVIPNRPTAPVPAFVGIAFCRNHMVLADPHIRLAPGGKDSERGSQSHVWNVEMAIDRGYAVATFFHGDVDPDDKDRADGVQARLPDLGWASTGARDRGTIAAWAWGAQRVVDYLLTEPRIDRQRLAVVGHSRNGKAALVAAAFDDRIALAIPHQAGCGGSAPSRTTVGETLRDINTAFPHWFNAAFKQFNDHPERLPFDQHCLVALMAPRPVLLSNAVEDTWANPEGQLAMLRAAAPVYRLYGADDLPAGAHAEEGKLLTGRLGYFLRAGKHSMTREDWTAFLDYADAQWGRPGGVTRRGQNRPAAEQRARSGAAAGTAAW
jgi:hypothetical protein